MATCLRRVVLGCDHDGRSRRGRRSGGGRRSGRSAALGGRGPTEQHGVRGCAGSSSRAGRQAREASGSGSGGSSGGGLFVAAGSSAAGWQAASEAGACRQARQAATGGCAAGQARQAAGRLWLGGVGLYGSGHSAGRDGSSKRVHVLLPSLSRGGAVGAGSGPAED